jgi:hypothetical protein
LGVEVPRLALELGAHCSKRGALFDYVRFLACRGRDTTSSVVLSNPDIHQSTAYGSDVPDAEVKGVVNV